MDAAIERIANIIPDGISVVDYTEKFVSPMATIYMVVIVLAVSLIGLAIGSAVGPPWSLTEQLLGFIFGLMIGVVVGPWLVSEYAPKKYEYNVTVSKDADVEALYENFDVIKKDGLIWTIQEKIDGSEAESESE